MKFTLSKKRFALCLISEPLLYFGLIFFVVAYKVSQGAFTSPMFKSATSLAEFMVPATCVLSIASGLLFLVNALRKALSKSVTFIAETKEAK